MTNQKEVVEEKEKILAIIDSLVDGLMVFDEEGKLSLINPVAQKFFGTGKEILKKSIVEFSNFPDLKYLFYLLGEDIKRVFRKELEVRENLILEVTSLPVLKEGKKMGSLVVLHDITREKTIEKMKTEFVSVSAHQLRTPSSAIKWVFETLLREKAGGLTEGQKELIEEGRISAERMINLINDLLDIVKIEGGEYLYKPTFSNLEKIVQSVIKPYQDKIREKQIKFEFQILSERLPKVKVDPEKIALAIQNLLDNAVRYTPSGGMVVVALKSDGKEMEFSIRDTGIGIPENQQKNIFGKFFRGSNAVKTETEGSGLGLFIAKNIVAAHNGKIWFQSEKGRGTTFYFTLPLK